MRQRHGLAACWLVLFAACKSDEPAKGGLVVSFETDMALPQQVDTMHVSVVVRGQYLLDRDYELGTQVDHPLPATLVLEPGDNPSVPVTVRVAGRKQSMWRTYRDFTSTIPVSRTALVRMPLQWLCDETAITQTEENSTGQLEMHAASMCGDDNTCRAGQCVPSMIDEAALPDFHNGDVFGDADDPQRGACFDVVACMGVGSIVTADSECTVPMPKNGDDMDPTQVNVALRVTNGGVCDRTTQTMCFVPLNGDDPEGFQFAGDRLKLPPAACAKQRQGLVNAIYTSTACSTKKPSNPPCGTWSSVPDAQAITPESTAMKRAGVGGNVIPVAPPTPTLVGQLMGSDQSVPCCSLSLDVGQLYACVCEPTSPGNAAIYSVVTGGGLSSGTKVTTINPPTAMSASPFLAAKAFAGNLYWVDDKLLQRTPLSGTGMALSSPAMGALYSQTTLLTDTNAVYALASGVDGATSDAAVQVIVFGLDTKPVRTLDTRGNAVVFQYGQDDTWLYIASDVDTLQSGNIWERQSTVVRVPKLGGVPAGVMPGVTITTADKRHGGYVGVVVDGSTVFALFENQALADGTFDVELRTVDAVDLASTPSPTTLYTLTVDPKQTQLVLLGAVDGTAILSRIENKADGSGPRSSTVFSVAANGGSPRILADFANDSQAPGVVSDDDRFYWINGTRRIYALPRNALQ